MKQVQKNMTNLLPTETVSFQVIKKACQNILVSCLDIKYILWTISASVLSGCSSTASLIKNSTCRCIGHTVNSSSNYKLRIHFSTSPKFKNLSYPNASFIHMMHQWRLSFCVHSLANFTITNCYTYHTMQTFLTLNLVPRVISI